MGDAGTESVKRAGTGGYGQAAMDRRPWTGGYGQAAVDGRPWTGLMGPEGQLLMPWQYKRRGWSLAVMPEPTSVFHAVRV
ncbi:hypothetical protein ACG0Z4_09025 [Enterocloster aldenensis]|uniref:hypothetical protein n=1 Tax=Enterocloster aldenensis TaxID=358742 RepID=UPI004025A294